MSLLIRTSLIHPNFPTTRRDVDSFDRPDSLSMGIALLFDVVVEQPGRGEVSFG